MRIDAALRELPRLQPVCALLYLLLAVTHKISRGNVLKTNFYQPTKVSLSFRLAPGFLPEIEYPKKRHGMFLDIGAEFRGFHTRFKDVARGGIRIVRSRGKEYVHSFSDPAFIINVLHESSSRALRVADDDRHVYISSVHIFIRLMYCPL